MSQSETTDDDVLIGEPPTAEESFYVSWGEEILRGSLKAVNEALQRLFALAGAMLGGSAVVLRPENVDFAPRAIAVACLALALIVSMLGNIPYETNLCVSAPYRVKEALDRGMYWKSAALKAAGFLLVLGVIIGVLGVVLKTPA